MPTNFITESDAGANAGDVWHDTTNDTLKVGI